MESTARHIRIFAVAAIVGVAALLCLASCGRSKTAAELERISLLTEEYPDSALQLLLATDTAAFADRADRARFAVALTNARYLAYDPDCNDSLLSLQADYFADAPADRFKMLYLYLSATFKIERKLFTEAITQLFDAAQIAEASADHLYAGRIYRAIRDIYFNTLNFEQALKYSKISTGHFKETNDKELYYWSIFDEAGCQHNIKNFDSCRILIDSCLNFAYKTGYTGMINESLRYQAHAQLEQGLYDEAIQSLKSINSPLNTDDYYVMARSYLIKGEYDSASVYNNFIQQLSPDNCQITCALAKQNGNYKDAYIMIEEMLKQQNDTMRFLFKNNLAGTESQYHQINSIKNKLKLKTQFEIFVVIAIILIMATIILYIHHRKTLKFKESEIEKYALIAKNLQTKFDRLTSETNSSIKSDFSLINELSQEFIINDKSNTNKIYSKVQKIIEDYRTSDTTLEHLEHDVDMAFDGLASRFKNEMPEIYPIYNRLFLLIALGFDSQSIPAILGVTQRAYYNKKNRLVTLLRDNPSILSDQLLTALKSNREKKQNHPAKS